MELFRMYFRTPCFFRILTHLYCPGCGGTRAIKALMHFQLEEAFLSNPTVVYVAVLITWCGVGLVLSKVLHKDVNAMKPKLWMLWIGLILYFGYAVLRNIFVYQFGYDFLGDLT